MLFFFQNFKKFESSFIKCSFLSKAHVYQVSVVLTDPVNLTSELINFIKNVFLIAGFYNRFDNLEINEPIFK